MPIVIGGLLVFILIVGVAVALLPFIIGGAILVGLVQMIIEACSKDQKPEPKQLPVRSSAYIRQTERQQRDKALPSDPQGATDEKVAIPQVPDDPSGFPWWGEVSDR